MFFDVRLHGDEVLMDEGGGLLVFIGLGIQPSAAASSGSGAEVEQDRPALFLRDCKRLVNISAPLHGHLASSSSFEMRLRRKWNIHEHSPREK